MVPLFDGMQDLFRSLKWDDEHDRILCALDPGDVRDISRKSCKMRLFDPTTN